MMALYAGLLGALARTELFLFLCERARCVRL